MEQCNDATKERYNFEKLLFLSSIILYVYRLDCHNHDSMDIMHQMKQSLPLYIVHCFDAAGYDTSDAICEMSDSSITEIEEYIEERRSYLPYCMRHTSDTKSSLPFKFPPGHRILISKFISTVKKSLSNQKPKKTQKISKTSNQTDKTEPQPKRAKVSSYEDIPTVTENIRRKILKWTKRYENGESNTTVAEGKDFTIKVRKSADPSLWHATIECRCGNSYVVTRNPKGEHQITNWSRHFKTCGSERKPKQNSTQNTLNMFVKVNQSPFPTNQHDSHQSPFLLSAENSPSLHDSLSTTATMNASSSIQVDPLSTGESCLKSSQDHFTADTLLSHLDDLDPLKPIDIVANPLLHPLPSMNNMGLTQKYESSSSSVSPLTLAPLPQAQPPPTLSLSPVKITTFTTTTSTGSTQSQSQPHPPTNQQVFY